MLSPPNPLSDLEPLSTLLAVPFGCYGSRQISKPSRCHDCLQQSRKAKGKNQKKTHLFWARIPAPRTRDETIPLDTPQHHTLPFLPSSLGCRSSISARPHRARRHRHRSCYRARRLLPSCCYDACYYSEHPALRKEAHSVPPRPASEPQQLPLIWRRPSCGSASWRSSWSLMPLSSLW